MHYCDHRISKRPPAYVAGKGQHRIILICLAITPIHLTHCYAPFEGLLGLVILPVELPPGLVVTSVVHELAGIAVATVPRLLVVLADVGLVVEPCREAYVRRRPQRAVGTTGLLPGDRVLPPESGLVIYVRVDPLVDIPGGRGGGGGVLLEGLLGLLDRKSVV